MLKQIKLESGDVIVVHKDVVGHLTRWIDSLYKASKELKDFGMLSALILDTNHNIHFAGGYFSPKSSIPMSFGMGEKYYGQYPGTRQVDVFPMYCALISKEVVEKIGIPENLGQNIFIDADYCLNVAQLGYRLYATDKITVVYQGGVKSKEEMRDYTNMFNMEGAEFVKKWGGIIQSHYKYPVLYVAKASGSSGFSRAARGYMHGLTDVGVNVYFEPLDTLIDSVEASSDEVCNSLLEGRGDMLMPQVIWGQAPFFIKNSGIYKIGHCEFETDEAPESWIRYCNMMDELWVPTEWDKEKFKKAGVQVPIYVIYQGIDPNYFHPNYAPMQTPATETFKFLMNGAWFPRKNIRNLVIAFQAEFKKGEDVCLIVKTMDLGLNKGIENEIKAIPEMPNSANVYIKEEDYKDEEMPSLYTTADCFVMPTRGEGWGLPIFEALACGVPVITTGYSAPFEMLRDKKGKVYEGVHFIDYTTAKATDPYVYMEGKTWAEPNLMQLRKLMRQVYNNRAEEKQKALKTSEIIRKRFAWTECAKQVRDRLIDIYANKLIKK